MPWSDVDEEEFQERKRQYFAEEDAYLKERLREVDMGLRPKCPQCGGSRYTEATKSEFCEDCGLSQFY